MTIDQLLDHVAAALDVDLDAATPGQLAELSATLITTLANISHRAKNAEHAKVAKRGIKALISQLKLEIHDSDPGDCERLVKVCCAIDFQRRMQSALTEARKAKTETQEVH